MSKKRQRRGAWLKSKLFCPKMSWFWTKLGEKYVTTDELNKWIMKLTLLLCITLDNTFRLLRLIQTTVSSPVKSKTMPIMSPVTSHYHQTKEFSKEYSLHQPLPPSTSAGKSCNEYSSKILKERSVKSLL